jgi:hypothetical protein
MNAIAGPRAGAATAAVLAALPRGAKRTLRLSCRAGRDAVDARARRLEVGHLPLTAAAAARMPLLREVVEMPSDFDARVLALAGSLRVLAEGPATVTRVSESASGHVDGSAGAEVVSALAGLTALTCLELNLDCYMGDLEPPLVLPWARIEVGGAATLWEGCQPGRDAPEGVS